MSDRAYPVIAYIWMLFVIAAGVAFLAFGQFLVAIIVFILGMLGFAIIHRRTPGVDMRTLDELIFDIAEYKRDDDFNSFFDRMKGHDVYTYFVDSNREMTPDSKFVVGPADVISVPCSQLPSGIRAATFFVHQDDKRLGKTCMAIPLKDALNFPLADPNLDAVVFYNRNISWLAVMRSDIPRVLARVS